MQAKAYEDYGKGIDENPLVVFLHGYTGSGTNVWFPYAFTAVSDKACQFISPDFPHPENPDFNEWKATIINAIEGKWNKKQKIILVGHSLGGYTALRTFSESRNEKWAKSVAGIYLVSPVTNPKLYTVQFRHYNIELDWNFLCSVDIPIRLIFYPKDSELDPNHSLFLIENLKDKAKNFSFIPFENSPYHPHFGGPFHYPVKEINDGIVSLIDSIL